MILNLNASAKKADQNTYTKCPNTIMAMKNGLICNIILHKSKQIKQE